MNRFSLAQILQVASFVFLFAGSVPTYGASEDLSNLKSVVVSAHTRSIYDIERLQSSIDAAPTATIRVPKGDTPSSLIAREYGIGVSDSKEAYSAIENKIFELNDIVDEKSVPTGTLIVPDLPLLTTKRPSINGALQSVVKNNSEQTTRPLNILMEPFSERPLAKYKNRIKVNASVASSLNYIRVDNFDIAETATFVKQAEIAGIPIVQGSEVEIQVANSATDCQTSDFDFITAEEAGVISKGLQSVSTTRERYLIILDSGWPTLESKKESLLSLRKIFDEVRAAIRVNKTDFYAFPATLVEGNFSPPAHPHSCLIERALRPMRRLDTKKKIQTIYIPLRPGQDGAKEYFREVLALSQLISLKGSVDTFSSTPTKQQIALAKTFSESSLKDIPALINPWQREDNVIRMYEPLISGLLKILGVYALIDSVSYPNHPAVDVKYWISTSWNFTKYASPPDLPASEAYMVFAAAGNDGLDFVKSRRLFASEVVMNRRIVAVMNSDHENGRSTCTTANFPGLWDKDYSQNAVVSFPGRISADKDAACPGLGGGTSFSAPRLAWLSASSELINPISKERWQIEVSKRLISSRGRLVEDVNAAPIDIKKFLSQK